MGSWVSNSSRRSREATPGALESCIGKFSPFRRHHTLDARSAARVRRIRAVWILCIYSCNPERPAAMPRAQCRHALTSRFTALSTSADRCALTCPPSTAPAHGAVRPPAATLPTRHTVSDRDEVQVARWSAIKSRVGSTLRELRQGQRDSTALRLAQPGAPRRRARRAGLPRHPEHGQSLRAGLARRAADARAHGRLGVVLRRRSSSPRSKSCWRWLATTCPGTRPTCWRSTTCCEATAA